MGTADSTAIATGNIPIRNIWLLAFYASRSLPETLLTDRFGLEMVDDIIEPVAEILVHSVERRIRYGLNTGLVRRRAVLARVRGRMDHICNERHRLLRRGRVACSFDDLMTDTPENRLVRAALDRVGGVVKKDGTRRRCRAAAEALGRAGVAKEDPRAMWVTARRLAVGWASPEDRPMLAAARLVLDPMLPTRDGGGSHAQRVDGGEWLRKLFEDGVRGFYRIRERDHGWKVHDGQKGMGWQTENGTDGIKEILPGMMADIVLTRCRGNTKHVMIIDTKLTDSVGPDHYGKRLKSDHIYQLYAYLRSQERQDEPSTLSSSGMLLYPSAGEKLDESVVIQGHGFRFATVDLTRDRRSIEARLLELVQHDG